MSFPDIELRALKERLKQSRYSVGSQTVEALLKRLDAAEAVIINNEILLDEETPNLTEEWRKQAGK